MFDLFDIYTYIYQKVSFSLPAPDNVKGEGEHLKGIPLPPNPAQVPNPIQLHRAKDHVQAEPVHHRQSEFLLCNLKKGKVSFSRVVLVSVFF